MYIVTTTFEKPSKDIPYYIDTDPELKARFLDFTSVHREMIVNFQTENADTTQISVIVYPDKDVFNIFMELFNSTFPTFFTDRDTYCELHGIRISRSVEDYN